MLARHKTVVTYLRLGHCECMPQMQATIHVRIRKCGIEFLIATLARCRWCIVFEYFFSFPFCLNLFFDALQKFHFECTFTFQGRLVGRDYTVFNRSMSSSCNKRHCRRRRRRVINTDRNAMQKFHHSK